MLAARVEPKEWPMKIIRTAALESNARIVAGGKELQERLVKLAGEWHFTLEGKTSVGT